MRKSIKGLLGMMAIASLAGVFTACGTNPTNLNSENSSSSSADEGNKNETLLNGFDNMDDLYAVKPIGVKPVDAMKISLNTDSKYIKNGEGSLRYEYEAGSAHTLLQYVAQSQLPDLDVKTLKSVSAEVYNASEKTQKVTLSMTALTGSALYSQQYEVEPGKWTTISYAELETLSYKQKSGIGGFSIRFDVSESSVFYLDDLQIEGGAEDLPPFDIEGYVESIAEIAPESALTEDTLEANLVFLDKVTYARDYVNSLEEAELARIPQTTLDKIAEYENLTSNYGVVYSSHFEENEVGIWYYGNGIIVGQSEDEKYGTVWSAAVNTAPGYEQSFKFGQTDSLTGYGDIFFYVYNPTDLVLKLNLHGGWKTFNFVSGVELAPKSWTKVQFTGYLIEYDEEGWLYPLIHSHDLGDPSYDGVFLFTSLYAEKAELTATRVIAAIDKLPSTDELTAENVEQYRYTVQDVRELFDTQSSSVQPLVTNIEKLQDVEDKIASLDAATVDGMIDELGEITLDSEKAIKAARKAYEELSALAAQKVTRLDTLVAAETALRNLQLGPFTELLNSISDSMTDEDIDKLVELINIYNLLSSEVKGMIGTEELARYENLVNGKLPEIVSTKINALPDANEAEMPREWYNFDFVRSMWSKLDEAALGTLSEEVKDKYNAYLALCATYTPVFPDYGGTPADAGWEPDGDYKWGGMIEYGTDSVYGSVTEFIVQEGQTNMPDKYPNNEFKIGFRFMNWDLTYLADSYSEIEFYVYNPLDHDVTATGMYSNWKYTDDTYTLKANAWTRITVATEKLAAHPRSMLWINESEYGPEGFKDDLVWKITTFYGVDPKPAAEALIEKIAALPETITAETLESVRDSVKAVRADYDAAVKAVQNYVSNYDKLVALETAIEKLDDEAAADALDARLDAIGTIDTAEKAVEANVLLKDIKADYAGLSEYAKSLISDYEARVAALEEKINEFLVDVLVSKIDALPEESAVEPSDILTIKSVKAEYDALTDEQKAKVGAERVAKLETLVEKCGEYVVALSVGENTSALVNTTDTALEEDQDFGTVVKFTASEYFVLKKTGKGSFGEMSEVIFYVYNDTEADITGNIITENDWSIAETITLTAKSWTKVTLAANHLSSAHDTYIYWTGNFKISDIYGVHANSDETTDPDGTENESQALSGSGVLSDGKEESSF